MMLWEVARMGKNDIQKAVTFVKSNKMDMELYEWLLSKGTDDNFSGVVKTLLNHLRLSEGKVIVNVAGVMPMGAMPEIPMQMMSQEQTPEPEPEEEEFDDIDDSLISL